MFRLIDFLTLPLFLLTPEQKAVSRILNALETCDLDQAVRTVEIYEKVPSARSRIRGTVAKMVQRVSVADLCVAFLFVLTLVLLGRVPVLDRLNFIDEHSDWKASLSFIGLGFCAVALAWRICAKWHEVEFERARRDIEKILRRRGRTTFERLGHVRSKYAPAFLNKLIRNYPDVFIRTTATKKKKPAITLLTESS